MLDTPGKVEIIRRVAVRLEDYLFLPSAGQLVPTELLRPLGGGGCSSPPDTGGAERQAQSMELGRLGRAEPPAGFSPLDAVSISAATPNGTLPFASFLPTGC